MTQRNLPVDPSATPPFAGQPPDDPFGGLESEPDSGLSPADFLGFFHEDRPWPLIAIKDGQPIAADFEPGPDQQSRAFAWASERNAEGRGIYFAINRLKQPLGRKAKKADVFEAGWLWVDCDPPEHAEPETWRAAKLAELRGGKVGVPPPTIIVDSGRGLWAFWRLLEPAPVDGRGELTKRVESCLDALAAIFDGDKNCANIDRIGRLPGFINPKTGNLACVIEHYAKRNFDFADFTAKPMRSATKSQPLPERFSELIDDRDAREAVDHYLTNAPIAVERKGGRSTTMNVLQRCQDLGCSFDFAIDLMMAEGGWNARCEPPWDDGEIADELRGLKRDRPVGCEHPSIFLSARAALAAKYFEPVTSAPGGSKYRLHFHGDADDAVIKEWLLKNTLGKVGVSLLSGSWGTYKTFLALDLAAAVMTKGDFAERPIMLQGGVLFIAAEGQDEVRPRLTGVVRAKVQPGVERLSDGCLPLKPHDLPFVWSEECPTLTGGGGAIEALRGLVSEAVKGLRERTGFSLALIVIDTLMSASRLNDANDRAEAQGVMNTLRKIAQEFEVHIMVVDHFGKDEAKGTAGASSKEDSADAVLAALGSKATNGKLTRPRIAFRKIRGGSWGEDVAYSIRNVPIGFDAEGETVSTLVIDWNVTACGGTQGVGKAEWPMKLGYFRTVLDGCLSKQGVTARPDPDRNQVRVVKQEDVRAEFMETYAAEKKDARRQAFSRSLRDASSQGLVLTREIQIDGIAQKVMWRADVECGSSDGVDQ